MQISPNKKLRRNRCSCGKSSILFAVGYISTLQIFFNSVSQRRANEHSTIRYPFPIIIANGNLFYKEGLNKRSPSIASSNLNSSNIDAMSVAKTYNTKSDSNCWAHFDFGMLDEWNRTATNFCSPLSGPDSGWLRCRVYVHPYLPSATAPHTFCDGANIVLDLAKLNLTECLLSRPGYQCEPPAIWYSYAAGALSANCSRTAAFRPDKFPGDHLRDMFAGFRSAAELAEARDGATADDAAAPPVDLAPVVLLVTRERTEHANMFHATTDFLNMFIALHMAGVIDGVAGSRRGLHDVQVTRTHTCTSIPFKSSHLVSGPSLPFFHPHPSAVRVLPTRVGPICTPIMREEAVACSRLMKGAI